MYKLYKYIEKFTDAIDAIDATSSLEAPYTDLLSSTDAPSTLSTPSTLSAPSASNAPGCVCVDTKSEFTKRLIRTLVVLASFTIACYRVYMFNMDKANPENPIYIFMVILVSLICSPCYLLYGIIMTLIHRYDLFSK